jgi:hypothetical protein
MHAEKQTNLMAIRAPRFDPDTIAELVVRIITTHSKPLPVVGAAPVTASETSSHAVFSNEAGTAQETRSKPAVSGRMALIQRAATHGKKQPGAASSSSATASSAAAPTDVPSSSSSSSSGGGGGGCVAVSEKGDAILVFLSGIQAIDKVSRAIRQRNVLQQHNAQVELINPSEDADVLYVELF